MTTEMLVVPSCPLPEDDDDSVHEGDPFLDPKGKGKSRRVTIDPHAIPAPTKEQAEKEAQEKLDAALAASLYEQSMEEFRRYKQRQAAGHTGATSSLPPSGSVSAPATVQEWTPPEDSAETGLLQLYGILPHTHTAVLVLLPSCAAELILICVAPVLAAIFFEPMDKALYVWIPVGNVVKCFLGMYLGMLCVLFQLTHLPRRVPSKGAGIPYEGWLFQLLSNFDLAIVMYFTFVLASACLDILGLLLSAWSWHAHGTDDVKRRLTFVLIVTSCCSLLWFAQCFAAGSLYALLRSWPTQFRPHCNPNPITQQYLPLPSDAESAISPPAPPAQGKF
eukprot:GGOE01061538.1.p1 GENE.GGOE01061538.1~~GGOE01061538.1.p1  ORF type:complete len:334 (+),score=88.06 GGOE01061538.1:106-1107(+)